MFKINKMLTFAIGGKNFNKLSVGFTIRAQIQFKETLLIWACRVTRPNAILIQKQISIDYSKAIESNMPVFNYNRFKIIQQNQLLN